MSPLGDVIDRGKEMLPLHDNIISLSNKKKKKNIFS